MNKRSAFLFSLLFIATTVFSQNVITDTTATVVAYWKKGDKKTYTLKKIIEQDKRGGGTRKDSASFKVTLQVLAETEKSYTIEWRYTTLSLPAITPDDIPGMEALCNNLRIVYTTDETGNFTAVNNLSEIQASMNKAFEILFKPGKLTPDAALMMKELKNILSNKESIEAIVLKEVQMFHSPYGAEFNIKRQSAETALPNVLGGPPFPALISSQLKTMATDKKTFSVETTTSVDKKVATKITLDFLNEVGKKAGKTPIKASEFPEMKINDIYSFVIHTETGWINKGRTERLVDAAGSFKKEIVILSLSE